MPTVMWNIAIIILTSANCLYKILQHDKKKQKQLSAEDFLKHIFMESLNPPVYGNPALVISICFNE